MKSFFAFVLCALAIVSCKPVADEQTLLNQYVAFLYDNMSLPDSVNYSRTYWEENVRTALRVRERMKWNIPEREFRHFVLPVRVNNEYLDDFRTLYADTLCRRVEGMTIEEAALEINHWCHEQATYRPSDARTFGPLSTMRASLGRCGEESVLAVAALRAAGIPARQVYTPRWAHTDDNHAWVEVLVDGRWHFMGACEPEPILNMGWFNAPASRAMLLHTKAFGQYDGPEDTISTTAAYTEINVTDSYLSTRRTVVQVVDEKGEAVAGARVSFQIYNYAELYPVATYTTDAEGKVSMLTGCGDIMVWAVKGRKFGLGKASGEHNVVRLSHELGECFAADFDIVPPVERAIPANPTPGQVALNNRRLAYEDSVRLHRAKGNEATLQAFRNRHATDSTKVEALLRSFSQKDADDVTMEVLEDAFAHAGDVFNPLVDAPRVEIEQLLPYFAEIGKGLSFASAAEVKEWVWQNIEVDDARNPQGLRIPPLMVWRSRKADTKSRDIFYVALCRAKGFPARLDDVTGQIAHEVDGAGKGVVKVDFSPSGFLKAPEYYRHFTLSEIRDGKPALLSFSEDESLPVGKLFPLSLENGYYMLVSGNRMADGSVLAHVEFFNVEGGGTVCPPLVVRTAEEKLAVIGSFYAEPYIPVTGRGYFAMVVLGRSDEPSIHARRQLSAVADELNTWGRKILLWGDMPPEGLEQIVVQAPDDAVVKTLTEAVGCDRYSLPLVVIADSFGRVVYFSQGYNTSLGEDLKRVVHQL